MSARKTTLPEGARRLFPQGQLPLEGEAHDRSVQDTESQEIDSLLIARLLEDGDRADLNWLCEQVDEGRLANWVRSRGSRQLSSRSRAFWRLTLGAPTNPRSDVQEAVWPL